MSFSTGRAQRRGIASASKGTSFNHVKQTPYTATDILRQPEGPNRATGKKRRISSIGDDRSTGLSIHGTHEIDTMEGTDPDGATPPVSGDTLSNPDFPVSYTGRGTLKFVSPIRIATVDGPLNVNGDIYSKGGLLAASSAHALWAVEVGASGGASFTEDAANTWASYTRSNDHASIHIHYAWSSKGSVLDGDHIYIKNLPLTLETQVHKAVIHPTNISATQLGSYFVADGQADADEFALYSADGGTGVEVAVTGAECGTTGTISCIINYHCVIP